MDWWGITPQGCLKPRQVDILQDQGIMSAQTLAMLAPDALAEVDGISDGPAASTCASPND
ncbi:MAG TPA: hypothetical protein VKK79_04255 [Candidatus Lokiarchaeia archaeon]|nr:hypothetical protein [Candidatus Lokiarchaeia archaeon]